MPDVAKQPKRRRAPRTNVSVEDDAFLSIFADSVAREISKHAPVPKGKEQVRELQRIQLENLVDLEHRAKLEMLRMPECIDIYDFFLNFIRTTKRNASAAQPYFREPEGKFTEEISPAIKMGKVRDLFGFHVNSQFFRFAQTVGKIPFSAKLADLVQQIEAVRSELVVTNLPLAISQARRFYSCTPKSHLDYTDLIQSAVEGLLVAVDKFRLPATPEDKMSSLAGVAVGRMSTLFIDRYSETPIRFYPLDRRRIYRVNKAMRRVAEGHPDLEAILLQVNEGLADRHHIKIADLGCLMQATSCLSLDWPTSADEDTSFGDSVSSASPLPDEALLDRERKDRLLEGVLGLEPIEQKVVCMSMGYSLREYQSYKELQ